MEIELIQKNRLGWLMVSFFTDVLATYAFGPTEIPNCANDTTIINTLLKDSYNKHYIPSHPTHVRVDMWVQEVTAVSELTQDFEIDLYINEFWEDPALVFDFMNPCKSNISFDDKVLQKLWIPNTCFINSKNAAIHESPFKNVFLMVFRRHLWQTSDVNSPGHSRQESQPCPFITKAFFHMNRQLRIAFPRCPRVDALSLRCFQYNYNTGEVRMQWNQPYPVMLLKPIQLPDFEMVNFSVIAVEQMYPAGWWDELTVAFVFKRRYGWYILQGYIPTMVTIVISWISFYLGPRSLYQRILGRSCLGFRLHESVQVEYFVRRQGSPENVFLMVFGNGTLWTNYRMKLTGPCDMNLKRFPFDQQKCFLTFESYNYNTGEVRMQWNQPYPVMLLKPIQLPDFEMVNFSVIAVEQMYPAGWWDELTVAFVFKRRYGW
ncbi:Neurotransmitter-gated ion-channel ligand binding domain protein [Ostertagia ostertagi]